MRTAEEIVNKVDCATWIPYNRVLELVREAQKEAWNEAIDAAAENATTKWGQSVVKVDKESILKLRK